MFIDENYDIYHMPCGDLCATTCLEQTENQPTYTVSFRNNKNKWRAERRSTQQSTTNT